VKRRLHCWAAGLQLPFAASALEINTASQAEIERVKGIGPTLSQRLLDERAERPFSDWSDLRRRVPGVGATAARRWSAQGVTVSGQAYAPALSASSASDASR
jgi:competence protein ComEA